MRTSSAPVVDVCICTYRRPSLADTLRSIDGQEGLEDGSVRILVADNDETPSARALIDALGPLRWKVDYIHAPARNISVARNACLDAARAPFVAWIDDDETAAPDWLASLLAGIGEDAAAFGPVAALYPPSAPAWIRKADLHSARPVVTRRGVITGYTSNALVRREAIGAERFLVSLGRSGGEDTEFFSRLHARGFRFRSVPGAVVSEPTASERLSLDWLTRRAYRAGQTHARGYIAEGRRWTGLVAASAKAAVCVAACGLFALDGVRRRKAWVRAALHRGVVARLLGVRDLQLY